MTKKVPVRPRLTQLKFPTKQQQTYSLCSATGQFVAMGTVDSPCLTHTDSGGSDICEQLSTLSLPGEAEYAIAENQEKDPRKKARKYQVDLCKKALEENVIVYLETGCGKTHIAVLLIYEMRHRIKKPQKDVCVFLAPTVALVQQQAKVIKDSIDLEVGIYCGSSNHFKTVHNWEKEIAQHEVLVMTPQILLHDLSHCFIKMEHIALLIFDECHYAQLESNHPYAEIMKIFYKKDAVKLPRIFGMTASPKIGKGGSIDGLESLLRAKVYSVEDRQELDNFVASPKVQVCFYSSMKNGHSSPYITYGRKLEEIMHQSMSALQKNVLDKSVLRSNKKSLQNLHRSLIFCLDNLGLWGALQASYIYLKSDQHEKADMVEEENSSNSNFCYNYVRQVASFLASDFTGDGKEADLSCVEVLGEPYFSSKLLRLIGILSNFRLQPDMKCIIFVNRIVTARSLTFILRNLKLLSSWKCDFLVGVHSGLTSRRNTDIILEKFRSGELNLLVATKVGEEGLDIQTCCLVIRFDLPETVASFIQSRGRARMLQSVYAFLVDRDNPSELNLIELFEKDEAQMNEEISSRTSHVQITDFEERTYKVDSTSATISSVSSVSLLHHYCSKLPHDEYFNPMPQFFYYDDEDGTVCSIILPANAPIHQIASAPQPSTELAKKGACLKACQELHKVGALTDYLLPEQEEKDEELHEDLSDPDGSNEEESRAELHEMLVPVALRKPWTKVEKSTCFSCYYIEFCPTPADREYRKFGLFVKEPLPEEAGKMKIDLCLARGRMVKSQLISTGVVKLDKDEIAAAEMFQKMYLRVILDRHKFVPEFVSLESDDAYELNSSTFYLLLPLVPEMHDRIAVDWALVKRCLSSPVFKQPHINVGHETSQPSNYLHLANGHLSSDDVVGSLVYVPCKAIFFFISGVFPEKNAHSLYNDSKSHVQHYNEKCGIDLAHPDQPLLQAKQLFVMDNLLRKKRFSEEWREKTEHFIELPPEICQLKVIGFSKDIGSSLSLLPSIMARLENFLVALELKDKLVASFPEGAEVTADRILEALTTERCLENFSLERLEVLGDAFLKLAVGRHLFLKHGALDEGQLTTKRSNVVNNSNLFKLATRKNLQVYIRDQSFEPGQFYAVGRPCPLSCTKETEESIHSQFFRSRNGANSEVRCNKCHHWLYNKTIADVLEALVGAFIVDSGFKAASAFLNWIGIEVDFSPSQIDNVCSASNAFLPISNQMDVTALENQLGYKFANKGLLIQAFVHPSFNNHLGGCYQRLEFLGDAVLDYMITAYTYSAYPNLKPGHLSDLRSACVNNTSFADVAGRWSFHKFIICDSVVLREAITKYVSNIRSPERGDDHFEEKACPKVLGDLVESCMGAIYLDSGFNMNRLWKMMQYLLDPVISISKLQFNPLRDLTELCQSHNWKIQCCSSKKDGKYTISAKVDEGVSASASATSTSKKAAKRMAAKQLFECLKTQGYKTKSASLEEVLSNSKAMDPVLIGYDETLYCGTAKSVEIEDSQSGGSNEKSYSISNGISTSKLLSIPSRKSPLSRKSSEARVAQSTANGNGSGIEPNGAGGPSTALAKSRLYEICTANCWKPPVFECSKETGPSHLREFVFKVVLEMGEKPNEIFEFYGGSRARKKDAAEHAAQGALWYLHHQGYVWDKKRRG